MESVQIDSGSIQKWHIRENYTAICLPEFCVDGAKPEREGTCGQRSGGFGSKRGLFGTGGVIAMIWTARLLFSSKNGALVTALSHIGL